MIEQGHNGTKMQGATGIESEREDVTWNRKHNTELKTIDRTVLLFKAPGEEVYPVLNLIQFSNQQYIKKNFELFFLCKRADFFKYPHYQKIKSVTVVKLMAMYLKFNKGLDYLEYFTKFVRLPGSYKMIYNRLTLIFTDMSPEKQFRNICLMNSLSTPHKNLCIKK